MHSTGVYLNKSVLAVKVDVAIDSCRDGGVARGDSKLPPVLLPMASIDGQVPMFHTVLDFETRLVWSWRGVDELKWLHAKVLA